MNNEKNLIAPEDKSVSAEKPGGFVQATKDFFGNALSTVKGKDLNVLVEDFSSEMTLVAEGLSEDQARLHELCESISAQQTVDRESLSLAVENVSDTLNTACERISALETGLIKLQKSMEQLEKKTEERKKHKLDNLSEIGRASCRERV